MSGAMGHYGPVPIFDTTQADLERDFRNACVRQFGSVECLRDPRRIDRARKATAHARSAYEEAG